MAQQPSATSQVVFGPVNSGGDIAHILNNTNGLAGWVDKNNSAQGVSFVVNGLQSSSAATLGAAGGVFSYTSNGLQVSANLPGSSAAEQIPFVVKASGYISAAAGTYTSTVQPLLYASTTAGFTAAAANAIFSAAAVTLTMTQTAASLVPFEVEAHLVGDSTSGKVLGWNQAVLPTTSTGTGLSTAVTTPATIVNGPTAVTFSATVPLQFAFGITVTGTQSAGSVLNLGSLFIES